MNIVNWAQIRAVLIAVALLAHGIYALPIPEPVSNTDVKNEVRQRDIAVWREWMASVGLEVSLEQFERTLIDTTQALSKLHRTLKKPFKPAFDLVGANQAWALFASASTSPDRLVIEIDRGEGWEPILRRLDPCCPWREPQLQYRRLRGVWDGQTKSMRAGYKGLTKWLAHKVFEEYPDAQRMRVYLERGVSVYPWQEPDPTLKIMHERVHRRGHLGDKP
jgi:hypothetical protein